jgi:hypothetical protein
MSNDLPSSPKKCPCPLPLTDETAYNMAIALLERIAELRKAGRDEIGVRLQLGGILKQLSLEAYHSGEASAVDVANDVLATVDDLLQALPDLSHNPVPTGTEPNPN